MNQELTHWRKTCNTVCTIRRLLCVTQGAGGGGATGGEDSDSDGAPQQPPKRSRSSVDPGPPSNAELFARVARLYNGGYEGLSLGEEERRAIAEVSGSIVGGGMLRCERSVGHEPVP